MRVAWVSGVVLLGAALILGLPPLIDDGRALAQAVALPLLLIAFGGAAAYRCHYDMIASDPRHVAGV